MDKIIVDKFDIMLNMKDVFSYINLYKDNNMYNYTIKLYKELILSAYSIITPKAVIMFSEKKEDIGYKYLECEELIYVIMTLGNKISDKISCLWNLNEYTQSILLNAIADMMIFNMEITLLDIIKEKCAKNNIGIKKRLEPSIQIPIDIQKIIWEETTAKELINVNITESFMLKPLKSNSFILVTNKCVTDFNAKHSCNGCKFINCKMKELKKIKIEIYSEKFLQTIFDYPDKTLMEIFNDNNIYIPFVCGGKGTCGKCKIQLIKGEIPITKYDENIYSDYELSIGFRLACKAYVSNDIKIKLVNNYEKDICSVADLYYTDKLNLNNEFLKNNSQNYGVAIDIGSTTIALKLIDLNTGNDINTLTTINGQRVLGADIITRIENSINGKLNELREKIRNDILLGLKELCKDYIVSNKCIKKIVISANTTMVHLFMGFDCKGLSMFPFTPVTLDTLTCKFNELFESDLFIADVIIMSGLSAYFGADAISGMLMSNFDKDEDISMIIDIGTNGEIAIGNKNKILCTSVAAGPALEGGGISCGIGSIQGAISQVNIQKIYGRYNIEYKTIGGISPIGICGSGIIDIVSEALKSNIVDNTGLLADEFFETGIKIALDGLGKDIVFTQKDIRQVQLSKSSFKSAIEVLISEFGCSVEDISKVYISGGFGHNINIDNAINIGLIPKSFKGRVKKLGNSSLGGAKQYLLDVASVNRIEKIISVCNEIHMGNSEKFSQLYIENMYF